MTIDYESPSLTGSGLFGFDPEREASRVVVIPVPWEATVSYRAGAAKGPEAILQASRQVDSDDVDWGHVCDAGLFLEAPDPSVVVDAAKARAIATRVIAAIVAGEAVDSAAILAVDQAGRELAEWVRARVAAALEEGRLPIVLGGDHSTPLGAMQACAAAAAPGEPLGILQIDAHADLREAFEGFRTSHASIMWNALDTIANLHVVQVGVRDFCRAERERIARDERVTTYFDRGLRRARMEGRFGAMAQAIVERLPQRVYVSFDIDGLDPAFCPNTGTPVPGGLSFDEVAVLFETLAKSGKRVVGADLSEVAPAAGLPADALDGWDAIVGARLLYKLIGAALASRGELPPQPPLPCATEER